MLACTPEAEPEGSSPVEQQEEPDVETPVHPAQPAAWGTPLMRSETQDVRFTEIWLDERASAALSLDGFGGVRLWPTLTEGTPLDRLAPIRLPIHEPGSLSFVRTDAGFLIAAIDTARSGRVIEVRIDQAGEARMIERFVIAPTDPLLELHVLEGGERLLALGVDHRIRLYDDRGRLVSELVEDGFIPWQLRVQRNWIVAVLGGPTRVQTIELRDDRLAKVGEPRTTLLDRGANHNDLQLTPDGQRVAVFRRESSKSRKWSLQLIDLDDGEVRVLTGKVGSNIRPRVHLVDDRRALLEDGEGFGYWIDLGQGAVREPGFVLPEKYSRLPGEAEVEARKVPLPYSHGRERWHASVVAGIRSVPADHRLVLDGVDEPDHRLVGYGSSMMLETALSSDGSRVAWSSGYWQDERIIVEELAVPGSSPTVHEYDGDPIWELMFIDDEHLLVVALRSASILRWRTGERVAEHHDEKDYNDRLGRRKLPSGALAHALRTPTAILNVVDQRFVPGDPATADTWTWLDLDDDVDRSGSFFRGFDPRGKLTMLALSPCGRWMATVEDQTVRGYGGHRFGPVQMRLAVYALDGITDPRELWSMPVKDHHSNMDLAWSADGERLAIVERSVGGLIVTPGGEVVFERRHGELSDSRAPDEPPREP